MSEPKAKTYRKAFIEVHATTLFKGAYRPAEVTTEAQAKKLVNRKPAPGDSLLVAVDSIRSVHAMHHRQSVQFTVTKGNTKTDVSVVADAPVEYARIYGIGDLRYEVHETAAEVRALIERAMHEAVAS